MIRRLLAGAATLGAAACASSGQMKQVETDLGLLRAESARRDSVAAAQLDLLVSTQRAILDSLGLLNDRIRGVRGDLSNDLLAIQQQLVQVQELTGQSQRRLSELRAQIEARGARIEPAAGGAQAGTAGAASADQMYQAALAQFRRGSLGAARAGFGELVRQYPGSELVPDALYFLGQSFAAENPDSAAAYYERVATQHGSSARAPTAVYNLGLLAERRNDVAGARRFYERVIREFPKSDEAALARDRVKTLGR